MKIDIRIIFTIAYIIIMIIQTKKGGGSYDFFTPLAYLFWTLLYAIFWIIWLVLRSMGVI